MVAERGDDGVDVVLFEGARQGFYVGVIHDEDGSSEVFFWLLQGCQIVCSTEKGDMLVRFSYASGQDDGLVAWMVVHHFDNCPAKVAGAASNCYFDHFV